MPPFSFEMPWAKLKAENGELLAALPLAEHLFDVGATFEALVRGGGWHSALLATAGRELTDQDIARLTVLAALHDVGKVNAGFQARWKPGVERVGHEPQVAALLWDDSLRARPAARALQEILSAWGADSYLAAVMAHHGRPHLEFGRDEHRAEPWFKHRVHWRTVDGYDPKAEAMRLIEQVRARWPLAWEAGEKLPDDPRFVAVFAGLLVLADWLGSDTARFPVTGPYGAERDATRAREAAACVQERGLTPLPTPPADFRQTFEFPPRGVQRKATTDDLGPVALFEAETGSGKTEAALWRWLELRRQGQVDGLFFALPTRSAAVQLHARVQKMLDRAFGEKEIEAVLAVPGYLQAGEASGQALPGYEVRWDDGGSDARWAAERSNRYLAARVGVGTIDQVLFGVLPIKHAFVRAAALARSLLVVDEVHASDAYMGGLLEALLANHVAAGGRALLLSATLGAAARTRLLGVKETPSLAAAEALPYPALSGSLAPPRAVSTAVATQKQVHIEIDAVIDDSAAIAARAVDAARQGASVLVVRNTVGGAIAVAQAVEALASEYTFQVEGVKTLHHGRFAPCDRRLLDAAVEAAFGKKRTAAGRVLVGTQTLEQSLDIDADLLITDLAPMDVLLQRIGRLHRHADRARGAFVEARAIVLRPAARDLAALFGDMRERHGLGPATHGGGPYPDVLQLEATLRVLETHARVTIPADNRRLVERSLHPAVLDALAEQLGTAWQNHRAERAGKVHADRATADGLSLDLATPFNQFVFPSAAEAVAARLGAKDLLIDLETPFTGPFRKEVTRMVIPHWMAGTVSAKDRPELVDRSDTGTRFRLGSRTYTYDRWGLQRDR